MKEQGILFQSEMVNAILEGTKTQTRRLLDPQPTQDGEIWEWKNCRWVGGIPIEPFNLPVDYCRYGSAGDRLWVRESWRLWEGEYEMTANDVKEPEIWTGSVSGNLAYARSLHVEYRADGGDAEGPWRPSMFMNRWASRLTLEIADIQVQRVQEISEDDAKAEGVHVGSRAIASDDKHRNCVNCGRNENTHVGQVRACFGGHGEVFDRGTYRGGFAFLWDQINGKKAPWESNPWVFAITFRRVESAQKQEAA